MSFYLDRFGIVGGQVLFIVVGKHRYHYAVLSHLLLGHEASQEISARRYPYANPQFCRQHAGHGNGISVVHRHHIVQLIQLNDAGYKFVRDALDAVMPYLISGESVGELAGSNGYALQEGFSSCRRLAIPMIVPPVPTPATTPSALRPMAPSWRTISSPVVR